MDHAYSPPAHSLAGNSRASAQGPPCERTSPSGVYIPRRATRASLDHSDRSSRSAGVWLMRHQGAHQLEDRVLVCAKSKLTAELKLKTRISFDVIICKSNFKNAARPFELRLVFKRLGELVQLTRSRLLACKYLLCSDNTLVLRHL